MEEGAHRYQEDQFLPISALQHLVYCPRQFALTHIEQVWADNRYTAEGNALHAKVNSGEHERRGDLITARSLRLHSQALGLSGIADVVEFRYRETGGCPLPGHTGRWQPWPVEYKRGRPKRNDCDMVQLCAQAICLEEMLDVEVGEGSLFYGKTRHRKAVTFDPALRHRTAELAAELHRLWDSRITPPAEYGEKCDHCSLFSLCMPHLGDRKQVSAYLREAFGDEPEGT